MSDPTLNSPTSAHSSVSSGSGSVSLPPIGSILKNIESYQTQQQLHDSQLLLEFNQRNSISDNDKYTFQRSESTHSIEAVQPEIKRELEEKRPMTHKTHSTPALSQRPTLPARSTSSFKESRPTTPQLSISTSISEPEDQESREASVDSTLDSILDSNSVDSTIDSPGSLTPNGNNKKRTNLPRETIEILNEWILNNMDNPYPNHTQKRYLLDKTGLSNVQLSNWFINKRRRRLFSNLSGNNGQPIKKKRLIDRL